MNNDTCCLTLALALALALEPAFVSPSSQFNYNILQTKVVVFTNNAQCLLFY